MTVNTNVQQRGQREGRTKINLRMHGQPVWGGGWHQQTLLCSLLSTHGSCHPDSNSLLRHSTTLSGLPERPLKESEDSLFNKCSGESISTRKKYSMSYLTPHATSYINSRCTRHSDLKSETTELAESTRGNSWTVALVTTVSSITAEVQTRTARSNTGVCMRSITIKIKYRGLCQVNDHRDGVAAANVERHTCIILSDKRLISKCN